MDQDDLIRRVHNLEATLNGLMIYIAAKEAGVSIDLDDPSMNGFIRENAAGREDEAPEPDDSYEGGFISPPLHLNNDGSIEKRSIETMREILVSLQSRFG